MTTGTGVPRALAAADARFLTELAHQLRADGIRCSTAAGSGHPTSAMSAADLMAVLLARQLSGSRIAAAAARDLVND